MYTKIQEINKKPEPFEFYTAEDLWTDPHTSEMMLQYHLNNSIEAASRNEGFIKKSVEWMISRFSLADNSSVCDFGCAVGHYTTALAKSGSKVTGIDFSERSLAYARTVANDEGLSIDYRCMNYLDFKSTSLYDLIIMIMCDYAALSPVQRQKILGIFRDSLEQNGAVLLDVYSLKSFEQVEEKALYEHNQLFGFWSKEDYYAFVNTFKYDKEKVALDKYTIFEENRTKVVYNWLQYFSIESIRSEFEEAGFKILEFYSNVAGKEYFDESLEIAVVAIKQ